MTLPNKLQAKSSEPTKKSQKDLISNDNDQVVIHKTQEDIKSIIESLHVTCRRLLNLLIGKTNHYRQVRPGVVALGRKLGIKKRQVENLLLKLESLGLINRIHQGYKNLMVIRISDYFLDGRIRSYLWKLLPSVRFVPIAVLSLAYLMTYAPSLNGAVDRDCTLFNISYEDIKNKSLSYCKLVPALKQVRFREWLILEQFDDEFKQDCINELKKSSTKPKNIFAYLMGICRQRAQCFDIEPDITKVKWLIAADVLRGNPASHIETQEKDSAKKGTSKRVYKEYGYGIPGWNDKPKPKRQGEGHGVFVPRTKWEERRMIEIQNQKRAEFGLPLLPLPV